MASPFCQRPSDDRILPGPIGHQPVLMVKKRLKRWHFRLNVRDVSSDYCQIRKNVAMKRLDHYDRHEGGWLEVLVEDRHAGPAETAASRIDFPAWLKTLSKRKRRIAWKLALGEAAGRVAQLFSVSTSRISHLRRELEQSWQAFHGELAAV